MPAIRENAPLERPRVAAPPQKIGIVVCLKYEDIRPLHRLLYRIGDNAEIGRNRAAVRALDAESAGLCCIM